MTRRFLSPQDYTIEHLLKSGASSEKIVLGIPTYGRSYTLFNEDATEIGAPADGPGEEGDATREKGYLAYYEVLNRHYAKIEFIHMNYVSHESWTRHGLLEKARGQILGSSWGLFF